MPGSEVDRFDPLGASTWLALAVPFGGSQLLGQLQYDRRNARDTLDVTDQLTYGARALRGSTRHNLFLELAGTQRFGTTAGVSRSNTQWSGGIEFLVADDTWLSTGFGKRYTAQGEPDRVVFVANMRWGIGSRSRLQSLR